MRNKNAAPHATSEHTIVNCPSCGCEVEMGELEWSDETGNYVCPWCEEENPDVGC